MGASAKPVPAAVDEQGTPSIPRILSPDEYEHAQTLTTTGLARANFPVLPPPTIARDAVNRLNPNAGAPDRPLTEQAGTAVRGSSIGRSPGLAGILTRQIAAPIIEHPFLTAARGVATAAVPALGTVWLGLMGKDVLEYAAQKYQESQTGVLAPDRISGEQAGTEAALLALGGAGAIAGKVLRGGKTTGAVEGADAATGAADAAAASAEGITPRAPAAGETPPLINGKPIANADLPEHVIAAATQSRDGRVFVGNMHTEATDASNGHIPNTGGPKSVGFVTNKGRFVDRTEAEHFAAPDVIARLKASGESSLDATDFEKFKFGVKPGELTNGEASVDSSPTSTPAALAPAAVPPATSTAARDAVVQHVADVTDALRTMAPGAEAKTILRAQLGEGAAAYEQAAFKVDEFRRAIDHLPETDKLGFVDAVEHGASQPSAEFQPLADYMRTTLDDTRDEIRALGTGKLEQYIENYFPHSGIWDDPDRAEMTFKELVGGRRPFEGTKSFLKERSFATVMDGVRAGLPLKTGWNPIDLFLTNYRDMQRFLVAHRSFAESKDAGLMSFVRAGELPPDGYARINDKMATVFGKPTVTVSEAFDAQQRAGLEKAVADLGGVSLERKTSIGGTKGPLAGALGFAEGDTRIVAKFGTHDGVIMHELGHILDARYGLQAELAKTKGSAKELAALADLRAESSPNVDPTFRAYLQKPEEQVANALHAYLHAPERMQEVAPKTMKALDAFLASKPELAQIRDIKPSLELGVANSEVPVGGMVVHGQYYAPKEVATIFNNHLSPGLPQVLRDAWGPTVGEGAAQSFEAYRGLGNVLNQAQLGFSAFHLGMTSLDAMVSRAALAGEYLASGKPLEALKTTMRAPVAALPGIAQGTVGDLVNHLFGTDVQLGLGAKIRAAYLDPATANPEMAELANAVKEAGGRISQDSFYKTSAADQLLTHLRASADALEEGDLKNALLGRLKANALSIPAALELAAKPLMEHIVPLQKLQVFGEMAQKTLSELGPDATLADRRGALQSAWDSVDNRMGQLVYDNLFWNRTFKDLAMASTRSVGWNLGTIRELGGGAVDLANVPGKLAKGEALGDVLTHRAAYFITLPLTIGLFDAVYQYARTGQGPSELKDYFYPKTGEQDADGNPDRVQPPSYMKDLVAYAGSPWQTVKHKVAPLPNLVFEMLNNEDFYGDEVRNPNDPLVKQLQQESDFLAKSLLPFGVRNATEQTARGDHSIATRAGAFLGMSPAPRDKVRSPAQNLMASFQHSMGGLTPEESNVASARRDVLASLRAGDAGKLEDAIGRAQLTPPKLAKMLKDATGELPMQAKFQRLTLKQAVDVFKAATPREQGLFADALLAKVERASKKTSVATGR